MAGPWESLAFFPPQLPLISLFPGYTVFLPLLTQYLDFIF